MSNVVTRFAPSPTGLLHLGNVRTALLNDLYARKEGGRFLLRFEDTDRDRSEAHFIEAIQHDLQWLGIRWDGEVLYQSAHTGKHRAALERLAADGHVYRCFCSESQLNLDRKLAASRSLPPRYSGRCRELSPKQSAARAAGEPFVWRLAIHAGSGEVHVHDALRGEVRFARADLDDPVVVRTDGSFTFLLPNAVDDAIDGITHTLRGDDHLTNSAYQVWLLERLGMRAPVYLHHGLLLGQDGGKLSKRSGSHSVQELREQGLLPEALVQAMARLGHPNMPEEMLSVDELVRHFEPAHVSTSSVRWSDETMWRWHTKLLHRMAPERVAPLLKPIFPGESEQRLVDFARLVEGNLSLIEEAAQYRRLLEPAPLGEACAAIVREAGEEFFAAALQCWSNSDGADWKQWTDAVKGATGRKGRQLFLPLRVALTGAASGPEMSHVVPFLGNDGVSARLQDVLEMFG